MPEICQSELPFKPWADTRLARLPGLVPVEPGGWLQVDDAYGAQMAYRRDILAREGDAVRRMAPDARAACGELLALVLDEVAGLDGFEVNGAEVHCPDGRVVVPDDARPLESLNALVQEDFCIMQKPDGTDAHVLTGALLCFPASWTLAEKFMRPLVGIHAPVASYDANIARRVQRLFDGVQAGRPVWRANALVYDDPDLYQPRCEGEPRRRANSARQWLRSERQTLRRLPESDAVVFSIHSYVVPLERLGDADRAALRARAE